MASLERQVTDTVVMVRPERFGWEEETAETNRYMRRPEELDPPLTVNDIPIRARAEFRAMVDLLRGRGISVMVLPSPQGQDVPAAVFPNNWFSHHADRRLVVYPMLARVRRRERQIRVLLDHLKAHGVATHEVIDLSLYEEQGLALEGTGSMVLDRAHRVAFALASQRTSEQVFDVWCRLMDYEPIHFHAYDEAAYPIYHTNVMMAIGEGFAVVCPETIADDSERSFVLRKLAYLDKEVIAITRPQLRAYCANILQLQTTAGDRVIVVSQTALAEFGRDQVRRLERNGALIPVAISVIEAIGGGSARCMLAEVFRPAG
jgi:hypothetical protein